MPQNQTLPTWLALNAFDQSSPSSFTDLRTGQPIFAGGLNLGDYFDLTEEEANQLSDTSIGTLHAGRYRLVHIDPNAVVGDIGVGKAAFLSPGDHVSNVNFTAGTGQTPGVYQITGVATGGDTPTRAAVIQVVVSAAGTVLQAPTIIDGGQGYEHVPTFTLVAGGTASVLTAQMDVNVNKVTGFTGTTAGIKARAVFIGTATPGNYAFVQELGVATLLAAAAAVAVGTSVFPAAAGFTGTAIATAPAINATAYAVDAAGAAQLFKAVLTLPVLQG